MSFYRLEVDNRFQIKSTEMNYSLKIIAVGSVHVKHIAVEI
jgi:hypothetical protein